MKCPICTSVDLMMTERQGVEIDYCPNCRGIWLDRGELDKIIDKAGTMEKGNTPYQPPQQPQQPYQGYGYQEPHGNYKHHKKNWLSELFD